MSGLAVLIFLAAFVGIVRPYIKGSKRWHFILAAFAALMLVGSLADPKNEKQAGVTDEQKSENDLATTTLKKPLQDVPSSKWQYSEERDEMRGGAVSRYAELDAENEINLDFPYGEQRGQILVRQSPKFGFDILVGVPNGQILCHEYSGGHINVKFDDKPIRRYGCSDASDGTNNMVFVSGAKSFLSELKRSKRVIVEAEFFHNGMQQMNFDSAGLNWK